MQVKEVELVGVCHINRVIHELAQIAVSPGSDPVFSSEGRELIDYAMQDLLSWL